MNSKQEMKMTGVSLALVAIIGVWIAGSYKIGYAVEEQQAKEKIASVQMQATVRVADITEKLKQSQKSLAVTQGQLDELHRSLEVPQAKGWNVADGKITAYSPLDDQNGINSDGEGETTSIGLRVGYGRFAVDPKRIPYGSDILIVYPDGSTEQGIAADTGGALRKPGKIHIDVYRRFFEQCIKFGSKNGIVLWKAPSK